MIVVTGATGNVGGEIVRALAGAGQPVRAVARPGKEPALPAGVEAATGDLDQPDTLRPALAGERITGRPPRTFREWAAAHADELR
jgi:uncharacterized protein YbjT (DUF2867 family)